MKNVSVALLMLLTGCASYNVKPVDPVEQAAGLEARRLDTPAVHQFFDRILGNEVAAWPPTCWDLKALTLAALYFHPDLDRAKAQGLAAEAAIITAGERPNPVVGATIQHSENPLAGESPWLNEFGVEIPFETAGKRGDRIEIAQYRAQAAQLRIGDVVWRVRSRVRASLLAAYPTEALMRRERDVQAEIAQMLERRFVEGFASQPEATAARLTLTRATLALQENRKQHAEGLARLAAAVGVPVAALDGIAITYDAFERLPPASALPSAEMRARALQGRPDVLAALAEYGASQSALKLEIAKQYPDISLGPGYVWNQGQRMWSLGLSIVLPVFNHNEGPIAEAEARREEAAAAFLAVQAKAIAEVDEALASYHNALDLVAVADALARGQQEMESSVTMAFQIGEADRLSWLSSQYQTVAAELARVDTQKQAQWSLGNLEDALRHPIGDLALSVTVGQVMAGRPSRVGEQP